jgi:thiol-disulfide isomerase/thioredoxin
MAPAKTKTDKRKTAKNTKGKPAKNEATKKKTNKTKKVTPKKNKDESTIVLVYANWCPHCQTMKPEWNEMKNRLGMDIETIEIEDSDFDKDMKIRDIEDNKLNGEHIEIVGYPTMFKVHNGHADYYGGNRTASDMINWAKSHKGGYVKSKIRATNRSIRSKSQ